MFFLASTTNDIFQRLEEHKWKSLGRRHSVAAPPPAAPYWPALADARWQQRRMSAQPREARRTEGRLSSTSTNNSTNDKSTNDKSTNDKSTNRKSTNDSSTTDSSTTSTNSASAASGAVLAQRALGLLARRDLLRVYRDLYADHWDRDHNPLGKINLCTAENNLCEDLLEEKLNDTTIWQAAAPLLIHYQTSQLEWVKTVTANYIDKFIGTNGDPSVRPSDLVLVPGCNAAYDMIGCALLDADDAVLAPVPFYVRLADNWGERARVRVIPVLFDNLLQPKLCPLRFQDALDEARKEGINVKAISLINPHNPLGCVFPEDDVVTICKWAVSNNLFIIADEVFASTFSSREHFRSMLSLRHQLGVRHRSKVVWMWSVSKDLCLPGARFAVVHTEIEDLQKALKRLEILQPCAPLVQHFVGHFLQDVDWLQRFHIVKNERLDANRRFAMDKLKEYGISCHPADSGLFLFMDLTEYIAEDSFDAEHKLWKRFTRSGVYLNPGGFLGSATPGWFRLVIGVPQDELEEGMKRLRAILLVIEKRSVEQTTEEPVLNQELTPANDVYADDDILRQVFGRAVTERPQNVVPKEEHHVENNNFYDAVFPFVQTRTGADTAEKFAEAEEMREHAIEERIEEELAGRDVPDEREQVAEHHLFGSVGQGVHTTHDASQVAHHEKRKADPLPDDLYGQIFTPSITIQGYDEASGIVKQRSFTSTRSASPARAPSPSSTTTTLQRNSLSRQYLVSRSEPDVNGTNEDRPRSASTISVSSNVRGSQTSLANALTVPRTTAVMSSTGSTTSMRSADKSGESEAEPTDGREPVTNIRQVLANITPPPNDAPKLVEDKPAITEENYEDIFKPVETLSIGSAKKIGVKSDDGDIVTDTRVFSKRDVEGVRHPMEATLGDAEYEKIFEGPPLMNTVLIRDTHGGKPLKAKDDNAGRGIATHQAQKTDSVGNSALNTSLVQETGLASKPLKAKDDNAGLGIATHQAQKTEPISALHTNLLQETDLASKSLKAKDDNAGLASESQKLLGRQNTADDGYVTLHVTQKPVDLKEVRPIEIDTKTTVDDSVLEKVFTPVPQDPVISPVSTRRLQRTADDSNITTDLSAFSRKSEERPKTYLAPTLNDETLAEIFGTSRQGTVEKKGPESDDKRETDVKQESGGKQESDAKKGSDDKLDDAGEDESGSYQPAFTEQDFLETVARKESLGNPRKISHVQEMDEEKPAVDEESDGERTPPSTPAELLSKRAPRPPQEEQKVDIDLDQIFRHSCVAPIPPQKVMFVKKHEAPEDITTYVASFQHRMDDARDPKSYKSYDVLSDDKFEEIFRPRPKLDVITEASQESKETDASSSIERQPTIPEESTQESGKAQPIPAAAEKENDLLEKVFEAKPTNVESDKPEEKLKKVVNRELSDGTDFPKQATKRQEKSKKPTMTDDQYEQIFQWIEGKDDKGDGNDDDLLKKVFDENNMPRQRNEPKLSKTVPQTTDLNDGTNFPRMSAQTKRSAAQPTITDDDYEEVFNPRKPNEAQKAEGPQKDTEDTESAIDVLIQELREHGGANVLEEDDHARDRPYSDADFQENVFELSQEDLEKYGKLIEIESTDRSEIVDDHLAFGPTLDDIPEEAAEEKPSRTETLNAHTLDSRVSPLSDDVFKPETPEKGMVAAHESGRRRGMERAGGDEVRPRSRSSPPRTSRSQVDEVEHYNTKARAAPEEPAANEQDALPERLPDDALHQVFAVIDRNRARDARRSASAGHPPLRPFDDFAFIEQVVREGLAERAHKGTKEGVERHFRQSARQPSSSDQFIDRVFAPAFRGQASLSDEDEPGTVHAQHASAAMPGDQSVKTAHDSRQMDAHHHGLDAATDANCDTALVLAQDARALSPLHLDVREEAPLSSSTLKRHDYRRRAFNDSGIGMEPGALCLDFPLLVAAARDDAPPPPDQRSVAWARDHALDQVQLRERREEHAQHHGAALTSPVMKKVQQRRLNHAGAELGPASPAQTEEEVWKAVGEEKHGRRYIKKETRRRYDFSDTDTSLERLSPNYHTAPRSYRFHAQPVDLDVRIRAHDAAHATAAADAARDSDLGAVVGSYNRRVRGEADLLLPDVAVTTTERGGDGDGDGGLRYVHHDVQLRRRAQSSSPRVIVEHTNITEVVYDRPPHAASQPELRRTRTQTRVHGLGAQEVLERCVFGDQPTRRAEERAERFVEFRQRRTRSPRSTRTRTSKTLIQQTSETDADEPLDLQRTNSGRFQRGVQTREDVDLCCRLRLIRDREGEQAEYLMCRNPHHLGRHDHCNPKRLYQLRKNPIRKERQKVYTISNGRDDQLRVSTANYDNSIDRVSVRHGPGSHWVVSSVCRTTSYVDGHPVYTHSPNSANITISSDSDASPRIRSKMHNPSRANFSE